MKMNNKKMKGMTLALLMMVAALAGCIGGDDDADTEVEEITGMDASDGGYTYASNVDNHRSLMKDLCDIKAAASSDGGYNFALAKEIYVNGSNAQKSDGSFRTLFGFASADALGADGKNHGYDSYYGISGSVDAHIMAAMDGTGDFVNASDTVRYQGIAKLTVNMGMVAYTIHELNTAMDKANAGNVDNDSGAPHNWDEGWAFFHGPDEDWSCSPAYVMKKRAADFGTTTNDVSNALTATETAMVDGLAALQAGDSDGYTAAVDTVVKNLVITYSQAVLKYTSKMDSNDSAEKYQAEGYAFWKAIEALVADHTDACYNNQTHGSAWIGAGEASDCDGFSWVESPSTGEMVCYNMGAGHYVYAAATNETICNGFASVFPDSGMPGYYADYGAMGMNGVLNLDDPSQLGTSYDVSEWLTGAWAHFGITAGDIGTYS